MPDDIESILNGIKYAESRGQKDPSRAMGDNGMKHPAFGAYQMRGPAFEDVKRLRPDAAKGIESLEQILGNEPLQRQLAAAYMEILMQDYGLSDTHRAIMAYNGGVGNVKKGNITPAMKDYLNTVLNAQP